MEHMDTYNKIICRECKKSFVSILSTHLLKSHGITREEYLALHPDAPLHSQKRLDQISSSAKLGSIAKLKKLEENPSMLQKQREVAKKVGTDWANKCRNNPEEEKRRNKALFAGRDKYSREHPEEVRMHGLKGLRAQSRRDSSLELIVEGILKSLGVEYTKKAQVGFYEVDFVIFSCNLVIEVQGDYWHGNPKKFNPESYNAMQKKSVARDVRKRKFLISGNWNLLEVWQSDLEEDLGKVVEKIKGAIMC